MSLVLSYDASILTPSSGFCTKNSLQSGSVAAKVGRLFIYNHSIKYCTCYNKKGCATLTHPFLFAFYLPASIAFWNLCAISSGRVIAPPTTIAHTPVCNAFTA